MEFLTKSAQETKKLGRKLGSSLKGGEIIALVGELGSGKTTFVQGLARGLGIKTRIISPTFILLRKYSTQNFYHVDLYRLEENLEDEVRNLGLEDVWNNKNNVVVIEWAEKIKDMLPKNTVWMNFEVLGNEERRIRIKNSKVL